LRLRDIDAGSGWCNVSWQRAADLTFSSALKPLGRLANTLRRKAFAAIKPCLAL